MFLRTLFAAALAVGVLASSAANAQTEILVNIFVRPQMETAAPKPARPNHFETEFGSAARAVLDAIGDAGHFVLDCVRKKFRGGNNAGRDECEQQRVFDRGDAALVIPESCEIL